MIPKGTAPRLENPKQYMRLRVRIFIQYFDLETSEFIRLVSDKSKIKSWALRDPVAVLFHFHKESPKGRAGSSPAVGWSQGMIPAHQGVFQGWQPSTQHPWQGRASTAAPAFGPTSGLLHRAHSCTWRKLLQSGVFYPGDDPGENWRSGAQERGKAIPVSPVAAIPQLVGAPARWTGSQTTAFHTSIKRHIWGFFPLWDWEW